VGRRLRAITLMTLASAGMLMFHFTHRRSTTPRDLATTDLSGGSAPTVSADAARGSNPLQPDVDSVPLEFFRNIKVDYVITPKLAQRLPKPLSADFAVEMTGNVVIGAGGELFEAETGASGLTVDRLAKVAPDSFAFDRWTTLLGITGRYFGQLEDDGAFSRAIPLPVEGMRLSSSANGGGVYLFGGNEYTNRRVYAISEEGQIAVIAEMPTEILAVTDSKDGIFVATGRDILRITQTRGAERVIRLPEDVGACVSIAVSPNGRTLFFSTVDRVYAMRGTTAFAIVRNLGGSSLCFQGRALYIWNPTRAILIRVADVESAL